MTQIFVNTTTNAFLETTIPYEARKRGNVSAARLCYATSVILYQKGEMSKLDVTRLLDKALELTPNFLDADRFRQEIWHKILIESGKSMGGNSEYHRYLHSPAWSTKKAQVFERDKYRCTLCNVGAILLVHHRTYDNIGREPLEDLTTLCTPCHEKYHLQPSDPQTDEIAPPPSEDMRFINGSDIVYVGDEIQPPPPAYTGNEVIEETIPFEVEDTTKDQPQTTPPADPKNFDITF